MARFKLLPEGVRRDDGACIPPDDANGDWREYLAWLADGNTPDAADPPAPDPTLRAIHPFYFRLRFTQAQRTTFDLSTDPAVVELRARFLAASTIGLDDQRTSDGLDLMAAKGLIQPGDKAALLADRKPDERP